MSWPQPNSTCAMPSAPGCWHKRKQHGRQAHTEAMSFMLRNAVSQLQARRGQS